MHSDDIPDPPRAAPFGRRAAPAGLVTVLVATGAHLTAPPTLVAMAAAAVVCGLSGPFGTLGYLSDGPRFLFWAVMVAVSYAAGALASEIAWQVAGRHLPATAGRLAGALGPALVTPPVVLSVNTLLLGTPYPFDGLPGFAASLALTGGVIGLLVDAATGRPFGRTQRNAGAAPAPATTAPQAPRLPSPRLLARLPAQAKGRLIALSAENHRVRVRTTTGETRLLLRLSDAIAEADGIAGLRVHRSRWVALDQVRAVGQRDGRTVLHLSDGAEVPVSRRGLTVLRGAGLVSDSAQTTGRPHG
jgi:hypothetical protein